MAITFFLQFFFYYFYKSVFLTGSKFLGSQERLLDIDLMYDLLGLYAAKCRECQTSISSFHLFQFSSHIKGYIRSEHLFERALSIVIPFFLI